MNNVVNQSNSGTANLTMTVEVPFLTTIVVNILSSVFLKAMDAVTGSYNARVHI